MGRVPILSAVDRKLPMCGLLHTQGHQLCLFFALFFANIDAHHVCSAPVPEADEQTNASGMSHMQVLSDEEKRERWDAGEDLEEHEGQRGHNPFWHMQQGGAQFHFQWEH